MKLKGKRIVVLAEELYEDLELWYPVMRFREEGARVSVAGPEKGREYRSKHGYPVTADEAVARVRAGPVDALIVPGGYAPDRLRRYPAVLDLVRQVNRRGGVIAFICHGGWVPISAGILKARRCTSVAAIKDDMENAGARWVDAEVVRDGNLISSRCPDDLPAFCRTLLAALTERRAA